MLADNQLAAGGRDDPDLVRALLAEIDKAEWEAIGFGADEAEAILEDAAGEIEVKEIETGLVDDRFWISIRGPLGDQATALELLQEAMKKLPEADVELGPTPL